ncbi:MAG: 4-hydroxy-tetrahydrodipicolinate reductase [Chitinophagales bacterium]
MKIALIGYGKMGKTIEEIAIQRGHEISLKIDIDNLSDLNEMNLARAEVAIEFTGPHSAFQNVMTCLRSGVPVICGSTGWLDKFDEAKKLCHSKGGALLYSSNFSIGVNIFFEVNKKLAALMATQPEYEVALTEIHHTEKKDAPSGTAISLAQQILGVLPRKKTWVNHTRDNPAELEIISERIDPAAGTHKVKYSSAIDDIEIIHTAHNRRGFAAGAVLAAEFIRDKKGVFTMQAVLGL